MQEIPLSDLHPFEGHPFRVVDDEEMLKTAESVREFGVLTPAIVRPDPDGGYEIISGPVSYTHLRSFIFFGRLSAYWLAVVLFFVFLHVDIQFVEIDICT